MDARTRVRHPPPAGFGRGLERERRSPASAAVALLVHVLFVAFLIQFGPELEFRLSRGSRDATGAGGGGGGGKQIQAIAMPALATPPPAPVVVKPVPPPPPVVPVEKVVAQEPVPVVAVVDTVRAKADTGKGGGAGSGDGSGKGPGSGTGSGSGSGSGNGSGNGSGTGEGGGDGGTAKAPEPRQMLLPPPNRPERLRGVTIAITFKVDSTGKVVDVSLDPAEPGDRGFAKKLTEIMRGYRFRPARSAEGFAVAGITTVRLTF